MNQLYFWNFWHPHSRNLYYFLLSLLALVLIWYGVSYFLYPTTAIQWELISTIDKVSVEVEQFKVGLFDFAYNADNYVVSETYRGSNLQVNIWAVYAFLFIVALSLVMLSVIISTLKRFWYYFGILLLIGVLVSFKLEQLLLFGEPNKAGLIIALAFYLPATYYFHNIRPDTGLFPRLFTFAGITLVLALLIALFAEAAYPAMVLISYGLVAPVVLSIFFIFIIGHVIISVFLIIVTRGNTFDSKRSMLHFSILSVVYLASLFLLYLKNTGSIQWDLLYLNAFFILFLAAVAGIWEFRLREVQYQSVFRFDPLGGFFYLILAIVTFATCSYFFTTANDPIIETLEDSIVFSQIGFGLLFFLYVIANFIEPLMENKQVFRIMYKPATFPYGTAQIVGTIATTAFFLNANMFSFYQGVAGYYNGLGDLNLYDEDRFVAEQYYKLGDQYGYNNHRSNYALGMLARMQNDEVLAPYYFREALTKNPTSYAFANLSNALVDNGQFFEALFNLRNGLNQFPDHAHLQNNLALIYGKTSVIDSALFFLEEAMDDTKTRKTAEANTLSVIARSANQLNFSVDTLLQEIAADQNYIQNQINTLLLLNQKPQEAPYNFQFEWKIPQDSVLGSFGFAYLYNYLFHHRAEIDTSLLQEVAYLMEKPENGNFYEPLSFALAVAYYENNQVVEGFKILDRLQSMNPFKTGYYNNVLGLWALQQHAPDVAAQYFGKAGQATFEDAKFRRAVSLTEGMAFDDALSRSAVRQVWQVLSSDTVEVSQGIDLVADDMLKVLNDDSLTYYMTNEDDPFLYQLIRYRAADLNVDVLDQIFTSFDEKDYQVLALHDLLMYYPDLDSMWLHKQVDLVAAGNQNLSPLGKDYWEWVQALQMERNGAYMSIENKLEVLGNLSGWHRYKKQLYTAKIAEISNDTVTAKQSYQYLISNPFFEKGFLSALDYLYPEESSMTYYNLMLDAIQTNQSSPVLLKAYIKACLANGLESYAEKALEDLKALVAAKEYAVFLKTYQKLLEEYQPVF